LKHGGGIRNVGGHRHATPAAKRWPLVMCSRRPTS
jgi:hypothetical protein